MVDDAVRTAPGRAELLELHKGAGAVFSERNGVLVPRHYGDPTGEYRAAVGPGALFDRSHRALLQVEGRSPGRMLTGIVSGSMPPDPEAVEAGVRAGRATYSTVLTPKGKVVTDLRVFRLEGGESGGFLLDVPRAGLEGLLEHLKRYLPPRFARLVEASEPLAMLTVTGTEAASVLSREVLGLRVDPDQLGDLAEGRERIVDDGGPVGIRVVRTMEVHPPAWDVLATAGTVATLWSRLSELGLTPSGSGVWDTLRIERGRPAYGVELDRDTLLPEAGIAERAVDHQKGCYTGQEVIVRIRDRGRVNRHLRGFFLGELPTPTPGTPLFIEGRERQAGEIRSTAQSPRFGQGVALGYLRREAEPPTGAWLGSPDGPEIQVRALADDGWVLVEGDPGRQ